MSNDEPEAPITDKDGIKSYFRTPEEVEELRRKYLLELTWEGTRDNLSSENV